VFVLAATDGVWIWDGASAPIQVGALIGGVGELAGRAGAVLEVGTDLFVGGELFVGASRNFQRWLRQ
jgi:hypothetical protein